MTAIAMREPMFSQFFINPIKALHKLKDAGFTEKQSEAQIEIMIENAEHIEATLATKRDLKELEVAVRRDIAEFEAITKRDLKEMELSMKRDLKELEVALKRDLKEFELKMDGRFKEMDSKFKELEMKLTIRMGAITSSVVGFFYLLEKFF